MNKPLLLAAAAAITLFAAPVMAEDGSGAPGKMERGRGPCHHCFMEKMDADGDGIITEAEFTAHCKERFAKLDADGNGEVTKDEFAAHHKEMREARRERADEFRGRKAPPPAPAE